MKKFLLVFFLSLLLSACGESPQQLFDTAELEMLQNNIPHAEKLYQEILDKHPDSEVAASARRRLDEIRRSKQQ